MSHSHKVEKLGATPILIVVCKAAKTTQSAGLRIRPMFSLPTRESQDPCFLLNASCMPVFLSCKCKGRKTCIFLKHDVLRHIFVFYKCECRNICVCSCQCEGRDTSIFTWQCEGRISCAHLGLIMSRPTPIYGKRARIGTVNIFSLNMLKPPARGDAVAAVQWDYPTRWGKERNFRERVQDWIEKRC